VPASFPTGQVAPCPQPPRRPTSRPCTRSATCRLVCATASRCPPFRFRDFGALVALSDYNAFGTLGRFGFFKGGFIKGRFAPPSHALLYRRHQLSLHGPGRAALLWMADGINALVQPDIRIG